MIKIESQMRRLLDTRRLAWMAVIGFASTSGAVGCGKSETIGQVDAGSQGGMGGHFDAGSTGGMAAANNTDAGPAGGNTSVNVSTVVVSTATRRARTTTWSVNYWMWMPTYGDNVTGTEAQVAALKPAIMRVGGYNNDANTPDAFNDAQFDRAVTYARAIGAEPLIQVPLLADIDGKLPTAATAAAMVTYANVTKGYAIKYFSVGNEPDIYAAQGSRVDPTLPAIPNYLPSDYCTSARAYVTAMKAVDPTIKIVGPDLAYQYHPGYDWLTPILQSCGDLFDIVSIHRYPFSSTQATFDAAMSDSTAYGNVLTSVRTIMQNTGAGDKPLALMEMNVAYNATACQLGASPSTLGSALWLADSLGTSIEHDLWTSAIWDISDDDVWALGMIGLPPAHKPRAEYYAYQLYADHFGPTLVDSTQLPPTIRTYSSRNQADNATDVIVVNWSTSSAPLAFQVTGLTQTPASPTFTVPALSISAIEIPDNGTALAWTYGEAQHRASQGPVTLVSGADAALYAGPQQLANACSSDASVVCSKIVLPSPTITTLGTTSGSVLTFGSAPHQWSSYTYAASGQTPPSATVTPDGNGIHMVGGFVPPVNGNWAGAGLYFVNSSCVDASAHTGIKFDFSGDLGGCSVALGANYSGDESSQDDAARGSCPFSNSVCYPPMSVVTPVTGSDAGTTTFKVPFTSFGGGSPNTALDPSTIITVQWQLGAVSGGPGCSANFTVENVAFY